jgi:hypothetical protein
VLANRPECIKPGSIGEENLEKRPHVILAFEGLQVIHFGVAAVGAGDEGVAIGLDLKVYSSTMFRTGEW